MHLGNLFGAIADERLAHQSGGVFYLRIEDTDQKREVPGGVKTIIDVFSEYELPFDEGSYLKDGATFERGAYGPYSQRKRADIYHVCAKYLMEKGEAYPCFLTEDELAQIRKEQEAQKINYGVYGAFAKYRNLSIDEVKQRIEAGEEYVVRLRSNGNTQNKIKVQDAARGELVMPENDTDVVILKSDGIPTYHFAHVVDDHFMRTSLVVRGEEWLATLPIHIQLFAAMGFKAPKYLHTAQLMKMDGGSKRKLSKRKDPELALSYYQGEGYTIAALKEYLLSLLNSNFEEFRNANPVAPLNDFKFSPKKMGTSGALFDKNKLDDVSKNVIAYMQTEDVYAKLLLWAEKFDEQLALLLKQDKAYALSFIAIGRGGKKPRKDYATFRQAKDYYSFYYD
jgi:glutamyl-tRNA synthetase